MDDAWTHDDEWIDPEAPCTWCGGDGWIENDDPLWFGFAPDIPCPACRGTGLRSEQTLF